jgi:hypothetical protein
MSKNACRSSDNPEEGNEEDVKVEKDGKEGSRNARGASLSDTP